MILYLMRHGPAEDGSSQLRDVERALTEDGRTKTRSASRGLKRLGVAPGRVLVSPALRARQTADIALRELRYHAAPEVLEELLPGARADGMLKLVEGHQEDVLVIGHEPDLSAFAIFLLGQGSHVDLALAKAGALALSFKGVPAKGTAKLLWYLRRKELSRLGA